MAINVTVVERPLPETSYLRATLKGLANTFKHLIDPDTVTTQYPEEREAISRRWRGTSSRATADRQGPWLLR